MPRKNSDQTDRVLGTLYQDFDADHYGLDLMKRTSLASGTLYPILIRLEGQGLVKSFWETEEPAVLGRPRRRLYRLTGAGIKAAQDSSVGKDGAFSYA